MTRNRQGDFSGESALRAGIRQAGANKKRNPAIHQVPLELMTRFELVTSSLPTMNGAMTEPFITGACALFCVEKRAHNAQKFGLDMDEDAINAALQALERARCCEAASSAEWNPHAMRLHQINP